MQPYESYVRVRTLRTRGIGRKVEVCLIGVAIAPPCSPNRRGACLPYKTLSSKYYIYVFYISGIVISITTIAIDIAICINNTIATMITSVKHIIIIIIITITIIIIIIVIIIDTITTISLSVFILACYLT